MSLRVTVDSLSSASKHSKQAENVSIVKCAKEYWPVILADGSDGPVRMPITLTGVNSASSVYPGPGEWSVSGSSVRIFESPEGGGPLTTGKVATFPKTVYAEGRVKGTGVLTLRLLPGGGILKDNPATESLLVKEPKPQLTLEPKVIGVKGTNAKLTLDADIPFDKGVLRILSGGDRIQLLQDDTEVTKYEFTSKTELEVKAVKGSALDGVEFEWKLDGVAEKRTAKLTVVEGTLEIYSKSDAKIGSKQRVIHKAKSRAKVVVSCQPKEWVGQLELESASQKVKLFTNSIGPLGEGEKRQVAASDTPKTFYVQGLETSGALWDTGLKLHLVGLANAVDEAKITVIETSLEVSKPYTPAVVVGRDSRVEDFGTGPSVVSAPAAEVSGEVTLYGQFKQFRSPRALVRIQMKPKDAPCKLIVRPVQEATRTTFFPEADERHRTGEIASVDHTKKLEIPPGGIGLAESARSGAGNAGRYGADGYVLWAEGTRNHSTPTVIQLDVEAVDDDCGKAKFHVVPAALRVEVQRSDNLAFRGAVDVEVTDVATADQTSVIRFPQTIPKPIHPNPATHTFAVPIGNYRVKVTPRDAQEKKFRVTLTSPADLPVTVPGPPVDAKFLLEPPYKKIQFIGYLVRTGTYKGLDNPAGLTLQQNTDAQTQAKAFAMASVLDVVDAKIKAGDVSAPTLKNDLKGKNFDQVKADMMLNLRVGTVTGINLDQAYAKELEGVKTNIARREGAKTDIEKRCAVMKQAVEKAYASTGFAADPQVLKIFMAPEFYFRGQQGAYAVESLHQILPAISPETSKAKYNDWLFVLGSAIGYREKPEDPYEEVTAAVVPNTAKTKVFVKCHDALPGSLADTGWDFLVGTTAHAIEDKQDSFANGWHAFTFTLDGVVSYPASNASLAVWNGAKVGITSASKTAIGRFTFKKAHAALNIQPGWVLKRGGARLSIVKATKIDDSNWTLEVRLKTGASVGNGRAEVTEGRLSRDHSGTFTVSSYAVAVDHPAGNMASKCILSKQDCVNYGYSFFKLRVAGPMAGTYDVANAQPTSAVSNELLFDPATPPAWKTGSTLTVWPDRCEVFSGKSFKEVQLTIDFVTGRYPSKGWRFEQGTVKGIVPEVKNPQGTKRDVVLRMPVDQALDPTLNIKFITSSRAVEIFNVCFVQKGGAGAPASSEGTALKQRMVEKETISSVDFTGPEYATGDFYDPLHHLINFYDSQVRAAPRQGSLQAHDQSADAALENKPGTSKTFKSNFGDERDVNVHTRNISERSASGFGGGSLFDMDGLSFGLEVCLDHAEQRLKQSGAGPVRVQLVPSCGMSIKNPSKHMLPNGFIFNVDGSSVASKAQQEDGTVDGAVISSTENAFVSTVPEYGQLFEAPGSIVVHDEKDLI